MKLSFVISTQPTKFQAVAFSSDFEANVAHLAALGYDGVELAVREPAKLDVVGVKRVLAKHRLQVPALGTGQAYVEEHLSFTDPNAAVREQAIARVHSHIALARGFGVQSVIASEAKPCPERSRRESPTRELESVSSQKPFLAMTRTPLVIIGLVRGLVQPNVSPEQAHAWMLDAMKTIAHAASDRGVRLVIEPLNRYETNLLNTVAETLALIDAIGVDNVGVLFDTFHANIEEPRIEESLRACGARLFHVHVADSNRWAPGAGHVDFARVIATLREMKYDGWVSAEILPKPSIARAAEQTMKALLQVSE